MQNKKFLYFYSLQNCISRILKFGKKNFESSILNPQSSILTEIVSWGQKKITFFVKIFFSIFLMQLFLSEGENLGHPKKSCRFIILHRDTCIPRYQDLAQDSNLENRDMPIVGVGLEFHVCSATRYA